MTTHLATARVTQPGQVRSRGTSTTDGETTPAHQGRDWATFPDRPTTTLSDGWHAKALPIAGRQASLTARSPPVVGTGSVRTCTPAAHNTVLREQAPALVGAAAWLRRRRPRGTGQESGHRLLRDAPRCVRPLPVPSSSPSIKARSEPAERRAPSRRSMCHVRGRVTLASRRRSPGFVPCLSGFCSRMHPMAVLPSK